MKRLIRIAPLLPVLLLAVAATGAPAANTAQALVDEGHLEIGIELTPPGPVVPGQKITLGLTIATDRWFSGGTRISLPEVPGLVILQTEQFATNASERRGDQSWVQQRWTLDVYPQRAGDFTIPPVNIRVKVNAGAAGTIEGDISSPPASFAVTLPATLADVATWVAAPAFTVSQQFDRALDELQVGDAFEREIVFEASEVMAMMLPTFEAEALPGLAAYPAPPVLDNSNNRGESRASRSQRISYVVQAEGQYSLSAADFFWWDTTRRELHVLSLPATRITVGGGAAAVTDASRSPPITGRQLLMAGATLVLLAALLGLAYRYLPRVPMARLGAALKTLQQLIMTLRKPALPERLNPGNSAGE